MLSNFMDIKKASLVEALWVKKRRQISIWLVGMGGVLEGLKTRSRILVLSEFIREATEDLDCGEK